MSISGRIKWQKQITTPQFFYTLKNYLYVDLKQPISSRMFSVLVCASSRPVKHYLKEKEKNNTFFAQTFRIMTTAHNELDYRFSVKATD